MSDHRTPEGAKSGKAAESEPRGARTFERLAGDITREIGVTGGMPDNWVVTGGTAPPVGPYGATDSGDRDLRGEHDEESRGAIAELRERQPHHPGGRGK